MDDPRSAIANLLDAMKPRRLLLLSPDPHGEWRRWCAGHGAADIVALAEDPLSALETLGRFDMALVLGLLERMEKTKGVELIGRLRNLHTEHLFVLIGDDARWRATDWYGLAMQRVDRFQIDNQTFVLYGYDLADYNRVRSWNNPRYWANPENWNKYRW